MYTRHQKLFLWPNQLELDGQGMYHVYETEEVHKGFGGETWGIEIT
jgi:hypothetical protein